MTLKEKFEESINYQLTFGLDGEYNKIKRASSNVETIADSYAIKFAEWCLKFDNIKNENKYIIEQLLETFKNEKGL